MMKDTLEDAAIERVREIAQDPWAKMMMGRSKSGAAKELKSFSVLRKKVGEVVMMRAEAAGEPEVRVLVKRLTGGD